MPRHRRSIAGIAGIVTLLVLLCSQALAQAPDKAEQVRVAYENARKLYRQGKYQEAIKAFDEVKDLQYHPILDYGLANCYEALRDYQKAIYYLDKYVRNYDKHKMSPKHPSLRDVHEKIGALKAKAASPPPPDSGDPTPPQAGDPAPGPDPYAIPPPPGAGVPTHGAPLGWAPFRRTLMLTLDAGITGFGGYAADSGLSETKTGGGLTFTALFRFIPYLAVGLHGGFVAATTDLGGAGPAIFAAGALEFRAFVPLRRIDLYGGIGIGYGMIRQNAGTHIYSYVGPSLHVVGGLDWFVLRNLSIGALVRVYRIFPTRYCSDDSGTNTCVTDFVGIDPGIAWYLGLSFTYHLSWVRRR